MSKAVLISIQPKWCDLIVQGMKTVEVRKTRPSIKTPFKVYIYCTKGKKRLLDIVRDGDGLWGYEYHGETLFLKAPDVPTSMWEYQQKVIGEFVCDAIAPITFPKGGGATLHYFGDAKNWYTGLTVKEAKKYCGDTEKRGLYGWHISDLVIYDHPKELSDFWYLQEQYCEPQRCKGCPRDQMPTVDGDYDFDCEWRRPIERAPQSWCYVEEQ